MSPPAPTAFSPQHAPGLRITIANALSGMALQEPLTEPT